ncbi:unnamed protein product, partial [Iphiclides podalirius]
MVQKMYLDEACRGRSVAGLFTSLGRARACSGGLGGLRRRARARARPLRHCDGGCRVSALARASARPAPRPERASTRAGYTHRRAHTPSPSPGSASPTSPPPTGARTRSACAPTARGSVKRSPGPAIVARCKGAATVNSCVRGGERRHPLAIWPRPPADSMRAAARRPAPT